MPKIEVCQDGTVFGGSHSVVQRLSAGDVCEREMAVGRRRFDDFMMALRGGAVWLKAPSRDGDQWVR